jgi:catechol 2,3-dioxygenase-like lactoylglutathione lyase family enzyme
MLPGSAAQRDAALPVCCLPRAIIPCDGHLHSAKTPPLATSQTLTFTVDSMRFPSLLLALTFAVWDHSSNTMAMQPPDLPRTTTLTTLAYRVHNMDAMVQFYRQAFGAAFRPIDTHGLSSQFGRVGSLTLKFVPLRESVDFVGFPVHQPGFVVSDVRAVVALAERFGGRQEGGFAVEDGRLHAAVRDPDGNTIELFESP